MGKFRGYDKWGIAPESQYRGLSSSEHEWLAKFNAEWTANNKVEDPLFDQDQRRQSYRRRYHRRRDCMNIAFGQVDEVTLGSGTGDETIELIDRHNRLQRIRSFSKKSR